MCKAIEMVGIQLPKECAFFGHKNVRHADGGWNEIHDLQYQLYLIRRDVYLQYTVPFAYPDLTQRVVQNKRETFLVHVDLSCAFGEKEGTDDPMSRNMVTAEMIGDVDEDSTMSQWPDCSIDALIQEDCNKISA